MIDAGYTEEEIVENGYEGDYFKTPSWIEREAAEHSDAGNVKDELLLKALDMEEAGYSKAEIRKMLNDAYNKGANYDAYMAVYSRYRD